MTLTPSTGSRHARILSVGGYRGSRVVDNDEMCTIIDSGVDRAAHRHPGASLGDR